MKRLTGERSYIFSMQSIRFQQHARQTKSKFNPQLRLFYPWSGLVAPRRRLCITALRARQMPGRPHHHTHGHQGLHRTSYSRVLHASPQPGTQAEKARMDVVFDLRGSTYYINTGGRLSHRSPPMLDSYPQPAPAQATWLNVKRRNSSTGTPASTWSHSSSRPLDDLATTHKVHQTPVQ